MQNIIEINKKSDGYRKVKALWNIAEAAKKEGKERFAYIHYNASTGNLEATDGRRAMTVRFPEADHYGIDQDALFEFSGNFLKAVEKPCDFPAVPRVIPVVGENKYYQHGLDVKALDLNDKYCPVDYEVSALLGMKGIRVNGRYLKDLKDVLTDFDLICWEEGKPEYRPVVFTTNDKSMEFVVMPMNNEKWTEAQVTISFEKKAGAAA
jgi:hypothetical protein